MNLINNRYQIIKKLDEGSLGKVILADDTLLQRQVALKTIRKDRVAEKTIDIFKCEFEVMTRLKHPNLAQVYDFGFTEDSDDNSGFYFLTMEYIDGFDLREWLTNQTDVNQNQTLNMMVIILRAIEFIHCRNILHRDLKPDNIMIESRTGKIKVMDFGLSDLDPGEKVETKGTHLYIAPEVLSGQADERVDIFALGVTFYDLLTGRRFYKETNSSLYRILSKEEHFSKAQHLSLRNIKNPAMCSILTKMTAYDPANRYQSCTEIIVDINDMLNHSYALETDETRMAYVLGAGFVGREQELKQLTDWLDAEEGEKKLLCVHGEAGIGKSRLYQEFQYQCQLQKIPFLQGTCTEFGGQNFTAFIPILGECLLKSTEEQIQEYGGELKKLLPDHDRLKDIEANPKQDPKTERGLLIQNITNFLLESSNRNSKVALYLNDMQWADDASVEALAELMYKLQDFQPSEGFSNLRVYISSREEGLEKLDKIKSKNRLTELELRTFDEQNVQSYIEAVFGGAKIEDSLHKAIPEINKKVGGSPFFLQELIKSLVELDVIVRQEQAWALTKSIEKTEIPTNLKDLIVSRIDRLNLTDEEGHVLLTSALMQYPPTIEEFNQIISVEHDLLTKLVNLEILRTEIIEDKITYRTAHDLIREVLLSQTYIISNNLRVSELHQHIAERLEAIHADDLEAYVQPLAYHYSEADIREKALFYLEKAGDNAQNNCQNKEASEFYERLLIHLSRHAKSPQESFKDKLIKVICKQAITLYILGDWDREIELLNEGIDLCSGVPERIKECQLKNRLGEVYRSKGNSEYAMTLYRYVIDILKNEQDVESRKTYGEAVNGQGVVYWRKGDYKQALESFRVQKNICEELGNKIGYSRAMGSIGLVYWNDGDYNQAMECYEIQQNICEELGDMRGYSYAVGNMGIVYFQRGDYGKAMECFEIRKKISEKLGDKSSYSVAIGNMGDVAFGRGDYSQSMKCYAIQKNIFEELGEKRGYGYAVGNMGEVYVGKGDYTRALECLTIKKNICEQLKDKMGYSKAIVRIGAACHLKGDYDKALKYFEESIDIYRKLGINDILCYLLSSKAETLYKLIQYKAAQLVNQEAQQIATKIDRTEVMFKTAVLSAKLIALSNPGVGVQTLFELLETSDPSTSSGQEQQAVLHYELYQIASQSSQDLERCENSIDPIHHLQAALDMYKKLVVNKPIIEYKNRIDELEETIHLSASIPDKTDDQEVDIGDAMDSFI